MSRRNRIALLAVAALLVAVTGTVLATRLLDVADEPAQHTQDGEEGAPPTAEDIAHAAERLEAHDLGVQDALLTELAAEYGLNGAVRIVAWSAQNDAGATMDKIRALRDGDGTEGSGMGWGRIAKELGVHPGIGSIMGDGGGHGRDDAPGQQDRGADEDDASGG